MEWAALSASQIHFMAVLGEGEQECPAEEGVCKELSSSSKHFLPEGEIMRG